MNKRLNPSPWLLLDDPDLTPDQVYFCTHTAGQGGHVEIRHSVMIGDTADEAEYGITLSDWKPLMIVSESWLDQFIDTGEQETAHVVRNFFGRAGTLRFACSFNTQDAENPTRMVWVLASSEKAARSAWRKLGETQPPIAVVLLSDMIEIRDIARAVRLNRGIGAGWDGRALATEERGYRLAQEKRGLALYWKAHPDRTPETDATPFEEWLAEVRSLGRAEWEADVQRLTDLRTRVRAKHAAEARTGETPS